MYSCLSYFRLIVSRYAHNELLTRKAFRPIKYPQEKVSTPKNSLEKKIWHDGTDSPDPGNLVHFSKNH